MTVAELRYMLRHANDDAEIVIADGDGVYTFPPAAIASGTIAGRPVLTIDLTASGCGITRDPDDA